VAYLLLFFSAAGILTSTIFTGMVFVAAGKYLASRRREKAKAVDFTPPVSILKPLHGSPPYLEECLEGYFKLDYPAYELLFCARRAEDAGLAVARKLADRYPQIPVKFLNSGEPPWMNARCYSNHLMVEAAEHEILIIADADVPVRPEYLREMVAPFRNPVVGAVTCVYQGVPIDGGFGEQLEALGMSVEMTSGVLVARMMEGVRFALGPSTAVRKASLRAFGGFERMGGYAADDYMLGFLVAEAGETVVLSNHVIDHLVLKSGFPKSIEHQLSWMRSTRFFPPHGPPGHGAHLLGSLRSVGISCLPSAALDDVGRILAGAYAAAQDGAIGRGGRAGDWQPLFGAVGVSLSPARPVGLYPLDRQLRQQQTALARQDF
jgi:ceramide glucosyltransferase